MKSPKTFTFRVSSYLDKALRKAASDNERSISEEIEFRLWRSFDASLIDILAKDGCDILAKLKAKGYDNKHYDLRGSTE